MYIECRKSHLKIKVNKQIFKYSISWKDRALQVPFQVHGKEKFRFLHRKVLPQKEHSSNFNTARRKALNNKQYSQNKHIFPDFFLSLLVHSLFWRLSVCLFILGMSDQNMGSNIAACTRQKLVPRSAVRARDVPWASFHIHTSLVLLDMSGQNLSHGLLFVLGMSGPSLKW